MYNPTEELLERLASPDVTDADVLEYLEAQATELERDHEGPWAPSPNEFFLRDQDLDSYRKASAWWPKGEHVPHAYAVPSITQLCFAYHEGPTFAERLTQKSLPVVRWLQAQGMDVSNPNETAEQRKTRLAREAQQRYRVRKAGKPEAGHAQAVADAYAAYMGICRMRKENAELWARKVAEARAAWEALKSAPNKKPSGLDQGPEG